MYKRIYEEKMNNSDEIMEIFKKIKDKNVAKIRKMSNDEAALNKYFTDSFRKMYKKFTSAYFRLNVLYYCLDEIKNSEDLYKDTVFKKQSDFLVKKADKMLLFADNILLEAEDISNFIN